MLQANIAASNIVTVNERNKTINLHDYQGKKMGIVRSTFIIDKQGQLANIEYGVTADGHTQKVLKSVKKL